MSVDHSEFQEWIKRGEDMGATHLISVCDTFDWEDYPVYVMPHEDVEQKKKGYAGVNMQRVNEVVPLKKKVFKPTKSQKYDWIVEHFEAVYNICAKSNNSEEFEAYIEKSVTNAN